MADAPGIGLLTTDRELIVRSWNRWLSSATGVDETGALGRPLLDLIPADRREVYREVLADVLDNGTSRVLAPMFHHYLFPCPPAQASSHFEHMQQRVTVAPLSGDGAAIGVMLTIEDMTATLDEQRSIAARLKVRAGKASQAALAMVGASDWRLRGAAVHELTQSASAEDVAQLLESLERDHQNLDVLSSALKVLISARRDVVPALVTLLSHDHANLRMHAALALGELRADSAVEALVQRALDDEDQNVRFHAIEALGRIAAPEAVEPLTRIAQSGDFFLSFPAIDALANTDDPRVVPSLRSLLHNDLLCPAVVDTLGVLGDEDCVAPLVELLNSGRGEPARVAAALEQIKERYGHAAAAGDHVVDIARSAMRPEGFKRLSSAAERREMPIDALVSVLGWMGARAVHVLTAMIGDPDVHAQAANGIVAIGGPSVEPLIERLSGDDRASRLAAAALLGRVGDSRAVPVLVEALASADAELVTTAAASLATLGDTRAMESLLALFDHDQPAVRQAAIAAVNAIGADIVEPRVRERFSDPSPHVRECAIRVAGYFGFESGVPVILEALADPHEDVRRAAIEQLPILDHPQAVPRLASAIEEETARNRAAAAHAARAVDDARLCPSLLAALADSDPWVRYFAAGSLGQRRDTDAAGLLAGVAAADRAAHVRIAAFHALGAIDPVLAIPLAERALSESDDDMVGAALAAIAGAPGPRADIVFEQAVRSASIPRRRGAIDALASRPTAAAVDSLAWAARIPDSPAVAAAAVHALSSIASAVSGDACKTAVSALLDIGTDPGRRGEAIAGLSRLHGEAMDVVADALHDPRTPARLLAVEALARMRHPRASAALLTALEDGDADVRAAAVASFGLLGTPAARLPVVEISETDPDAMVRRKAALVCARHGWTR